MGILLIKKMGEIGRNTVKDGNRGENDWILRLRTVTVLHARWRIFSEYLDGSNLPPCKGVGDGEQICH